MDQPTFFAFNTRVRQQFDQHCRLLSRKITVQQTNNERLSAKLDALINRKKLLIDRLRDLLAR